MADEIVALWLVSTYARFLCHFVYGWVALDRHMLFDSHVLRMFLEVAPLLIPHFVVLLTCGLSFVTLFGYNLVFDDYAHPR
jgi:hypothetical protein